MGLHPADSNEFKCYNQEPGSKLRAEDREDRMANEEVRKVLREQEDTGEKIKERDKRDWIFLVLFLCVVGIGSILYVRWRDGDRLPVPEPEQTNINPSLSR